MNNLDQPDLKIVSFSLGPITNEQILRPKYSVKRSIYQFDYGSWHGTVRFGVASNSDDTARNNRRLLLRFHSMLQGLNNATKITLPKDYQSLQTIPDTFAATYVSDSVSGNKLNIVVDLANAGTYAPLAGDYFNVDKKLFYIHNVTDTSNTRKTLAVFPLSLYKAGSSYNPTISFKDVFINTNLDGRQPIGREGKGLIAHTFQYVEF